MWTAMLVMAWNVNIKQPFCADVSMQKQAGELMFSKAQAIFGRDRFIFTDYSCFGTARTINTSETTCSMISAQNFSTNLTARHSFSFLETAVWGKRGLIVSRSAERPEAYERVGCMTVEEGHGVYEERPDSERGRLF